MRGIWKSSTWAWARSSLRQFLQSLSRPCFSASGGDTSAWFVCAVLGAIFIMEPFLSPACSYSIVSMVPFPMWHCIYIYIYIRTEPLAILLELFLIWCVKHFNDPMSNVAWACPKCLMLHHFFFFFLFVFSFFSLFCSSSSSSCFLPQV